MGDEYRISCSVLIQSQCSFCPLITLRVAQLSFDINYMYVVNFVQPSESAAESSLFHILPLEVCRHACHTALGAVAVVVEDSVLSCVVHYPAHVPLAARVQKTVVAYSVAGLDDCLVGCRFHFWDAIPDITRKKTCSGAFACCGMNVLAPC